MDEEERETMTCVECGHVGPSETFFDFPEEYSMVSYVCPECGFADLD